MDPGGTFREVLKSNPGLGAGSLAFSRDSSLLYVLVGSGQPGGDVVVVESKSLNPVRRFSVSVTAKNLPGLEFPAVRKIVASLNTNELFIPATKDGVTGLVALDPVSGEARKFIGPFPSRLGDIVSLNRGGGAEPSIAVGLVKEPNILLFLVNATTGSITDSVRVSATVPTNTLSGGLAGVTSSANGDIVYVTTAAEIIAVNVATKMIIGRTPTSVFAGGPAVSPMGDAVYVTDLGDGFDFPGSGRVLVYDARLQPKGVLQLPVKPDGFPRTAKGAVVSPDGQLLYVLTGTAFVGPLFPGENTTVVVMETATGKVRGVFPTTQFTPRLITLLP